MSIGIELSDDDLRAVRHLYKARWTAQINNWKERDTDYCMWVVMCPDLEGNHVTKTGQSLSQTIYSLLETIGIYIRK